MDLYKSLEVLKSKEPREAWAQRVLNRNSWLTVVAPHGGTIEPLTDRLAVDIAGSDYNLFVFEGLRRNGRELHVTSCRFREPELAELQRLSRLTLSVHGKALEHAVTLVGELNHAVGALIIRHLNDVGYLAKRAEFPFSAESIANFVNLTEFNGVQLEISKVERDSMRTDGVANERYFLFVETIRRVLAEANSL